MPSSLTLESSEPSFCARPAFRPRPERAPSPSSCGNAAATCANKCASRSSGSQRSYSDSTSAKMESHPPGDPTTGATRLQAWPNAWMDAHDVHRLGAGNPMPSDVGAISRERGCAVARGSPHQPTEALSCRHDRPDRRQRHAPLARLRHRRDPTTPRRFCWVVAEAIRNPPLLVTIAQRDSLAPPVTLTTLGRCQGGDRVYLANATNQEELQLYEIVPRKIAPA